MLPTQPFTVVHKLFTSLIPCSRTGIFPIQPFTDSHFSFARAMNCERVGIFPTQSFTEVHRCFARVINCFTTGILPIQPETVSQPSFASWTAVSTETPSFVSEDHQFVTLFHKSEVLFLIARATGFFVKAFFTGVMIFFFTHLPMPLTVSPSPLNSPSIQNLPISANTVDGE